jgi:hypothetical protein
MASGTTITAAAFAAYLKCPTKGLLIAGGERSPDTFFTDIGGSATLAYKTRLKDISLVSFSDLSERSVPTASTTFVDSETAVYTRRSPNGSVELSNYSEPFSECIPVLCSVWESWSTPTISSLPSAL